MSTALRLFRPKHFPQAPQGEGEELRAHAPRRA